MNKFFSDALLRRVISAKSLQDHTHIGIGSEPEFLFSPHSIEDLQEIILQAGRANLPVLPVGGCSNLIFGNVHNKIIISDENLPEELEIENDLVIASCNISISEFIERTKQAALSGLYFLAGIPAHLGGTVFMNAGAFDHTISDFLNWIEVIDENGQIKRISAEEIDFSYRKISINNFIFRICFRLLKKSRTQIEKEIEEVLKTRHSRHPYDFPSLGSTFKNPPGKFAGLLICECGLAGKKIGGAQISRKHSNFILNVDNASFQDYLKLIELARTEVKIKFGIELELENKVIHK